jgi:hypothetical protein
MIAALNPKRYRVEHIQDVSEALLRAELVLAHAAVVHAPTASDDLERRARRSVERGLALVFVSAAPEAQAMSHRLGCRFVHAPFDLNDLKRAVFRAVSEAHQGRTDEQQSASYERDKLGSAAPRASPRVLLMIHDTMTGSVMGAVLSSQLGVSCETATSAAAALGLLDDAVACVIAHPELLMATEDGVAVARKLARRGVPVVALGPADGFDATSAGQAAWDIMPQVRRSLQARDKLRRVAG